MDQNMQIRFLTLLNLCNIEFEMKIGLPMFHNGFNFRTFSFAYILSIQSRMPIGYFMSIVK